MIKLEYIIDNVKLRLNYVSSQLQAIFNGQRKQSREYLKNVKNQYKGKRCFIIGTGPSLTPSDLDMLKNEYTFASNRIFNIFTKTSWRPTFYGVFDETVAGGAGVIDSINAFDCKMKFVREQGYFVYKKIKSPVCFIHSWHSKKNLVIPKFSKKLEKGIYTIGTVTYALIQIAVYMGFDEIYLLGIDNKYANTSLKNGKVVIDSTVNSYFNGETKPDKTAHKTWQMDIAYEFTESFSRQNGFRVFNATRGGFLEAFERVSLEEIVNNK